jgi:hypothetical protein
MVWALRIGSSLFLMIQSQIGKLQFPRDKVEHYTRPAYGVRPDSGLYPDDAANASNAASVNLNQSARIRWSSTLGKEQTKGI